MALITCPECKKEISDTAISCPSCGFVLPGAQKVVSQVRTSKITYAKKNPLLGGVLIVIGAIGSVFSLLFLPIGIISLIGGIFVLTMGVSLCVGLAKVNCPYCGKPRQIQRNSVNMKCPYCKKTSVRDGDELHTVD